MESNDIVMGNLEENRRLSYDKHDGKTNGLRSKWNIAISEYC